MKLVLFTLFICSVYFSPALCQNTTTTTTTTLAPTTTTTTAPSNTTTTTTTAPTPAVPTFNFRLPKNESEKICFRANMSLVFNINYVAQVNDTKSNETTVVELTDLTGYDGECKSSFETLTLDFEKGGNQWSFEFNYTLSSDSVFELSSLVLKYVLDPQTFPNTMVEGPKDASLFNQSLFVANKANSYKCFSNTEIKLNDNVKVEITNYQAQPFTEDDKGFGTAVECSADTQGTSKLVPIIVGSALAILVVMVLVAYIIGRRKHRPGYQSV